MDLTSARPMAYQDKTLGGAVSAMIRNCLRPGFHRSMLSHTIDLDHEQTLSAFKPTSINELVAAAAS